MIISTSKLNINYFTPQNVKKNKPFLQTYFFYLREFDLFTTDEVEDVPSDSELDEDYRLNSNNCTEQDDEENENDAIRDDINKVIKKLKMKQTQIMFTLKKRAIFEKQIQRNLAEAPGETLF